MFALPCVMTETTSNRSLLVYLSRKNAEVDLRSISARDLFSSAENVFPFELDQNILAYPNEITVSPIELSKYES